MNAIPPSLLESPAAESTRGFIVSDIDDDSDLDPQVHGVTADPVGAYLKEVGKVALLTAEQEVDLARRIEVGLYAGYVLTRDGDSMNRKERRELELLANDGESAKKHFVEANLLLVVSQAKRYTGRGM